MAEPRQVADVRMVGMVFQMLPPLTRDGRWLRRNLSPGVVGVNECAWRNAAGGPAERPAGPGFYIWTMGRTSTAPAEAAGHLAAYATASSISLASTT